MSAYIKLSTMEYPRHIGDIQIDPSGENDYAKVEWVDPPSFNRDIEYLIEDLPIKTEEGWLMRWSVIKFPFEMLAEKIRRDRTQRLKDSDWTQVADAPVNQAAWATYRQALRDVPTQAGFPWDIQWPTKPE